MAKVKEITTNINGEVTGAIVLKGKTKEVLKRHSSTIFPLLTFNEKQSSDGNRVTTNDETIPIILLILLIRSLEDLLLFRVEN